MFPLGRKWKIKEKYSNKIYISRIVQRIDVFIIIINTIPVLYAGRTRNLLKLSNLYKYVMNYM